MSNLSTANSNRTKGHQKPASFWVALFAGSLGLHLIAFASLPLWLRSSESTAEAPLPIEMVELPTAAPGSLSALPNVAPPSEVLANPLGATADVVPEPVETAQTDGVQPNPAAIAPEPIPNPLAQANPEPAAPPAPSETSVNPPANPLPPSAPAPQPPVDQPPPDNPRQMVRGENNLPPLGTPGGTSDGAEAGEGSTGQPGVEDENLQDVTVSGETAAVQITARIGTPSRNDAPDNPEVPAQPLSLERTLTSDPTQADSCLVPPDLGGFLGQEVLVSVVINQEGRVESVEQITGTPSLEYQQLVECMVRGWQFAPATDQGIPRADNLIIPIQVTTF